MKLLSHELKERKCTPQDFQLPFGEHFQGIPQSLSSQREWSQKLPPFQSRWKDGWGHEAGSGSTSPEKPRLWWDSPKYWEKTRAQTNCKPISCPMPTSSDYSWERTRADSGNSSVPELLCLLLEHWQTQLVVCARSQLVRLEWDASFLTFTLKTHHHNLPSLTCGENAVLSLMLVRKISTQSESSVHGLWDGWSKEVTFTSVQSCSFSVSLPGVFLW